MKNTVTKLLVFERDGKVFWENDVCLGNVLADVDGYYKFWPDTTRGGYWDELLLSQIAKFLKEKNREWDEKIQRDLGRIDGGRTD